MHKLHMLSYDNQGGCINVLDEHFLYVTEDAALLQTVASALPQALWHR